MQKHRVVKAEGGDFVLDITTALVGVSNAPTDVYHLEVVCTVHPVDIQFVGGRGLCPSVDVPSEAEELEAGISECERGSQLEGIHKAAVAIGDSGTCLPLIGAVDLEVHGLCSAEDVAFRHSPRKTRPQQAVALIGDLGFEFAVVGFVDDGEDIDIEGVAGGTGVARNIVHLQAGEDTHSAEFGLHQFLEILAIERAATVEEVVKDWSVAHRRLLGSSTPTHGIAITKDEAVCNLIVVVGQKSDIGASDIVAVQGLWRKVGTRAHAQLSREGLLDGICPIGDVLWTEIVESVVAEELSQTLALCIKVRGTEGITLMDIGLVGSGTDEAVGDMAEITIFNSAQTVKGTRIDTVGNPCLQGIMSVGLNLVVNVAVEESIGAQGVLCHLGAQARIGCGNGAWCGGKGIEDPSAEAGGIVDKACIEPQSHGEGPSCRAAAEDVVIRCIGEGGIDFFLRRLGGLTIDVHFMLDAITLLWGEVLVVGLLLQSLDDLIGIHTSSEEVGGSRVGICNSGDDASGILSGSLLTASLGRPVVGNFRDARVEYFAFRQFRGGGTGEEGEKGEEEN